MSAVTAGAVAGAGAAIAWWLLRQAAERDAERERGRRGDPIPVRVRARRGPSGNRGIDE
ncbi:hypothetical protein [Nocardia sp. NPDC050710]|uniref:hypothetical protein n=1 Tax=Nocardia sp. NPDC050710 TaxID=3157220 RepID=UPI00340C2AC6